MPSFEAPLKRKYDDGLDELVHHKRPSLRAPADEAWAVLWRNPQYKKNKTWDGDGVLTVKASGAATLHDSDGGIIGTTKIVSSLNEGKILTMCGKEIELDRPLSQVDSASQSSSLPTGPRAEAGTQRSTSRKFAVPRSVALSAAPLASKSTPSELGVQPKAAAAEECLPDSAGQSKHWTVNWRKPQNRKHKSWDGDAYLSLIDGRLKMHAEDGKPMGSIPAKGVQLCSGLQLQIGGKEVELDRPVLASQLPTFITNDNNEGVAAEAQSPLPLVTLLQPKFQIPVSSSSFYDAPKHSIRKPLHDPNAPDSLVMKAPSKEHLRRYNKKLEDVIPVVVDPLLVRKMRPHQRDGVKFLYECVMGLRKYEGQGCILADEMGLGKTLQTIALVWTLLKQNLYSSIHPAVQKVLIVCPVSLVNNWKAEFHKWLGRDRVGVVVCDKNKGKLDDFKNSKVYQVLIIGYERLRVVIPPIGLVICDEGHRLKSASNKTAAVFKMLNTRKRVILSGTPIQNDLGEFHAMAEFCNPGLLDDYSNFRKVYEVPILKSRAPDATVKEVQIGEERTAQLLTIATSFVLRRDANLLKGHLPPKTEYVLFVTPTPLQLAMFTEVLNPSHLDDTVQSSTAESLALINVLNKISNSPILLKATADSAKAKKDDISSFHRTVVKEALRRLPPDALVADMSLSGKLSLLSNMLKTIRETTEEKCVLVSHYTSTLNILEEYCKRTRYSYYRLDGQTPQNKRQEYVTSFNKGDNRSGFIFLLSSKAGGVGINLIGASRLFIIDSDWNPSHDLQSMARCHRDGQKRPVFIYRLLTAGAIDEKIYQRQVTKLALSDSLIGSGPGGSKSDSFTRKDLRDIFRIHRGTACNTHDLLECGCELGVDASTEDSPSNDDIDLEADAPMGFVSASSVSCERFDKMDSLSRQKKKEGLASLSEWRHLNCLKSAVRDGLVDSVLRNSFTLPSKREGGLVEQIDHDAVAAKARALESIEVHDIPGGTLCFAFEKTSAQENNDSISDDS